MVRISEDSQTVFKTIKDMNNIDDLSLVLKLKPSMTGTSSNFNDSLRGLKYICIWICLLTELSSLLDEDTIEMSESEDNSNLIAITTATTMTVGSISTRQSSIRS